MITPNQIAESIVKAIIGSQIRRPKVINVNNKLLSSRGDISFQLGLEYWRGYVVVKSVPFQNSKNVLRYFMQRCLDDQNHAMDENLILQTFEKHVLKDLEQIVNTSIIYSLLKMHISNSMVFIKFERSIAAYLVIKTAIEKDALYGMKEICDKKFKLIIDQDYESPITNMRLNMLKQISENILRFQGYNVQNKESANNYIFTIKSVGNIDSGFKRYLCGAVLNSNNKKEKDLTEAKYLQQKTNKVKELNIDKSNVEKNIQKIANASISHELLSTKHTSTVTIDNSDNLDRSVKEASFVLYNNVRITAILDKYTTLVSENEFPKIIPIDDMKLFKENIDDESWSLIYNYVIKYPDVLDALISLEPNFKVNIHYVWSFVSKLCHDFSKYYRKNRILIRGIESNEKIVQLTSERLHMLRALRIILRNSLYLLGVEEVAYM